MSKINSIQNKSAVYSTAGEALKNISSVVLIFGIISSIIIFANSIEIGYYDDEVDWLSVSTGIEVLFASIFLFVFGRTIAKIANYAEAIYKNVNTNFEFEKYITMGAKFLPGENAMAEEDGICIPVIIKSIQLDEDKCLIYRCENETHIIKDYYDNQLTELQ